MAKTGEAITASQTEIRMLDLIDRADIPEAGIVTIESETIKYTGTTLTHLIGCTRGYAGSTAATHTQGKTVTVTDTVRASVTENFATEKAETYGDIGSHQTMAVDLTLTPTAGSATSTNPKYLAAMMGNIFGATLTRISNYIAGVIGAYSVTGTKASTYPTGAVLAQITDGVTACDGAVVAYIDGDGSVTTAEAAFKVMNNNSTPGSGFANGLDLSDDTRDGYPAVAYSNSEIRFSNKTKVTASGDTITFTNAAGNKTFVITMS